MPLANMPSGTRLRHSAMTATHYFGYFLIGTSAVLLAQHWQAWRDRAAISAGERAYLRRQLQRRIVASALIGVVGAAMTLVDRVPRTPWALSCYLLALVLAGGVILIIALVDFAAARRHRERRQWEQLAQALGEAAIRGGSADREE
jgi:peptidoglycan/LPS O-acetylase OafA/YrhL